MLWLSLLRCCIYLLWAAPGPHGWPWALLWWRCFLLTGVSCRGARGLRRGGFSSCGSWLLLSTCDLPGPGVGPVSLAQDHRGSLTFSLFIRVVVLWMCPLYEKSPTCQSITKDMCSQTHHSNSYKRINCKQQRHAVSGNISATVGKQTGCMGCSVSETVFERKVSQSINNKTNLILSLKMFNLMKGTLKT